MNSGMNEHCSAYRAFDVLNRPSHMIVQAVVLDFVPCDAEHAVFEREISPEPAQVLPGCQEDLLRQIIPKIQARG